MTTKTIIDLTDELLSNPEISAKFIEVFIFENQAPHTFNEIWHEHRDSPYGIAMAAIIKSFQDTKKIEGAK